MENGSSIKMEGFPFQFGFGFATSGSFPKEYGEIKIKQQTRTRRKDENG